jgi:arginase
MAETHRQIDLIGTPVDVGAGRRGCAMGPEALRVAELEATLVSLGYQVADRGNVVPVEGPSVRLDGAARNADAIAGWTRATEDAAYRSMQRGAIPIFMGGDHSLSMGSVSGVARHAAEAARPLFVLWLDAHSDFNTPATSPSGNMHGMPVAFVCGERGFDGILPANRALVPAANVFQLGIRSIDPVERDLIGMRGVNVYDMRTIDERGVAAIMRDVVGVVAQAGGLLHVSLDVDFLDPDVAPGVGTTVPGGATFREAHLVMEILCDSALVTSLDLVELNPFLDDRGKSARVMVELAASLFGRRIFDRPTQAA